MRTQTLTKTVFWTALACALNLHAGAISGTISSTVDVTEDTWLTDNVTCRVANVPCIRVAVSNIKLYLNGYTITGQRGGNISGCLTQAQGGNNEHGIHVAPGTRMVRGSGARDGAGDARLGCRPGCRSHTIHDSGRDGELQLPERHPVAGRRPVAGVYERQRHRMECSGSERKPRVTLRRNLPLQRQFQPSP